LLSIAEAAAMLGIGRSMVYELIAVGYLRPVHIGRACRLPVQEVGVPVPRHTAPPGPRRRARHAYQRPPSPTNRRPSDCLLDGIFIQDQHARDRPTDPAAPDVHVSDTRPDAISPSPRGANADSKATRRPRDRPRRARPPFDGSKPGTKHTLCTRCGRCSGGLFETSGAGGQSSAWRRCPDDMVDSPDSRSRLTQLTHTRDDTNEGHSLRSYCLTGDSSNQVPSWECFACPCCDACRGQSPASGHVGISSLVVWTAVVIAAEGIRSESHAARIH
jgi:excisionase family DNA binding protein